MHNIWFLAILSVSFNWYFSVHIENDYWGTWLVQLEGHAALDLGVVRLSPMLGIDITLKNKRNNNPILRMKRLVCIGEEAVYMCKHTPITHTLHISVSHLKPAVERMWEL